MSYSTEKRRQYYLEHKEQERARNRKWRNAHRDEINKKRRDARKKNIPAGDGIGSRSLEMREQYEQKLRTTENLLTHDDLGITYEEISVYRRVMSYE